MDYIKALQRKYESIKLKIALKSTVSHMEYVELKQLAENCSRTYKKSSIYFNGSNEELLESVRDFLNKY